MLSSPSSLHQPAFPWSLVCPGTHWLLTSTCSSSLDGISPTVMDLLSLPITAYQHQSRAVSTGVLDSTHRRQLHPIHISLIARKQSTSPSPHHLRLMRTIPMPPDNDRCCAATIVTRAISCSVGVNGLVERTMTINHIQHSLPQFSTGDTSEIDCHVRSF